MKLKGLYFYLVFAVFLLASCKKDDESNFVSNIDEQILAYLDSMNITDAGQDSTGLYAYPIRLNPSGKTQSEGNVLSFFYSISVMNGQTLDVKDSLDSDTTIVKQGVWAIYPVGLDHALSYLKEGEKWGFVLPPDIAYGSYSFSTILPEQSIILIEIDMLSIQKEDDVLEKELKIINNYSVKAELSDTVNHPLNQPQTLPNGMIYKRLKLGTGSSTPTSGQLVSVTYEGRFLDSTIFDIAPNADVFQFIKDEDALIPGFEDGVARMKVGEKSLIIMPSYLGYRESAKVIPEYILDDMIKLKIVPDYCAKVGPYQPLIFEITLVDIN